MTILKQDWNQPIGNHTDKQAFYLAQGKQDEIYVSGQMTLDSKEGREIKDTDAWLARFDAQGNIYWIHPVGTPEQDVLRGMVVDPYGYIFVLGESSSEFDDDKTGELHLRYDTWLAKFSPDGTKLWMNNSLGDDFRYAWGIDIDEEGNLYLAGENWLAKYNTEGICIWHRSLGLSWKEGVATLSVDPSGQIYVAGETRGEMPGFVNQGGTDIWLAKYDTDGEVEWYRQLGTSEEDAVYDIKADRHGYIYLTGISMGEMEKGQHKGSYDAWLAQYDFEGDLIWVRQLGSASYDLSWSVSTDLVGNVFLAGQTYGDLVPGTEPGDGDIWLAKFSSQGQQIWLKQLHANDSEEAHNILVDIEGQIFVTGYRWKEPEGDLPRRREAWLARFHEEMPAYQQQMLLEAMYQQLQRIEMRLALLEANLDTLTMKFKTLPKIKVKRK